MSQKQPLSPKEGAENGAQSAIIPGGGGLRKSGRVKKSFNPLALPVGKHSIGVNAASQFGSPAKGANSLGNSAAARSSAGNGAKIRIGGALTQSTILLGPNGEGGAIVPKASNGGILPAAASTAATATAVVPRRSSRAPKAVEVLTYKDHRAGSTAYAAAPTARANAGGRTRTGTVITFQGEKLNPSDLACIKHSDGSMEFPHSSLAMIEYAANLAIADDSNDFERTKGGAVPLAVLRHLQSKNLLSSNFTSTGRKCDLDRIGNRLRQSCKMEDCYRARKSEHGGDGTQCTPCYLDETQGTDRVRWGMMGSVSAKQKICILKMISREENRMYGLWTDIKREGGDLLANLTYGQVVYCGEWLVTHEWYVKREGDEERGTNSNKAKLAMSRGGNDGAATTITATATDDDGDDDDDDGDKKPRASKQAKLE